MFRDIYQEGITTIESIEDVLGALGHGLAGVIQISARALISRGLYPGLYSERLKNLKIVPVLGLCFKRISMQRDTMDACERRHAGLGKRRTPPFV